MADAPPPQSSTSRPKGKNPAVDQALIDCATRVPSDAKGKPDSAAMDACMRDKGFSKPLRTQENGEVLRPRPPKE